MDSHFLHLFAQHLGTEPERAAEELDRFVAALATSLKHTGRADVAGLGAFRVVKGHVAFVPAVEVANEVNARYAGLEDVPPPPQALFTEPARANDVPADEASESPAEPAAEAEAPVDSAPADDAVEARAEAESPGTASEDAPPSPPPLGASQENEAGEDARADEAAPVAASQAEVVSEPRAEAPVDDAPVEAERGGEEEPESRERAYAPAGFEPILLDEPAALADEPEPMPAAVSALSLADMLGEDAEPTEAPAEEEEVADEWDGIWAAADEPNAQPLGATAEERLEEAQFDVVAASPPPETGPVEDVEVETVDAPLEGTLSAEEAPAAAPTAPASPDAETGEAAAPTRIPRKRKKRVQAVSVSRDFLREREAQRRAALDQQRSEALKQSPPPPAAEPKKTTTPPATPAPPPAIPKVPPAVAALQSPPAALGDRRRVPERRRERNWLLPALLGAVAVLVLIAWAASGDGAADDVPAPAPVATVPADPAPAVEGPADTPDDAAPADAAPEDPFASPLYGAGGIDAARGGFTWVVTREGSTPVAQAASYTAAGYRAAVLRSASGGRTIERVCLGQFRTAEEAMAAQSDLPDGVPADRWLLPLSS